MKLSFYSTVALVLLACQSQTQQSSVSEEPISNADSTSIELNTFDTGIVVSVEDIGYPMFAMDLKSQATGKTTGYLLNIEAINIAHDAAYKLKGEKIELQYSRTDEAFVLDIEHQNQSLLGEWAPENNVGCISIVGILSGAEEASQGDLPGSFTVTTNDPSIHMTFEYYIDDALAKVNGDTVEVYYEFREVSKVVEITLTH